MGDLSAHLSRDEMKCPCGCNQCNIQPALLEELENIREYSGTPIIITSSYRCPAHNAAVGGKPDSAHLTGEAADIAVHSDRERFEFLEAIFLYDGVRVGIGPDFLHVDVSQTLPQHVCWLYGKE